MSVFNNSLYSQIKRTLFLKKTMQPASHKVHFPPHQISFASFISAKSKIKINYKRYDDTVNKAVTAG